MARIKTYVNDTLISENDKIIGTDADDKDLTKNYRIGDLTSYFINSIPTSVGVQYSDTFFIDVENEGGQIILLSYTGEGILVNMHSASLADGILYTIVSENGFDFTIKPEVSEFVDGLADLTVTSNSINVFSYNGNWHTF